MLRKKYYNMIEDMKGKIRVYCRVRPLSKSELSMVSFILAVMFLLSACYRVVIISQKVLMSTALMYRAPED